MNELDKVLEALTRLEKAKGRAEVYDVLGPELSRAVATMREIRGSGEQTSREIILKIGRLYWQKLDHKNKRGNR